MKITKESSKRMAEAKRAKKIARSKAMPPFRQIAVSSHTDGSLCEIFGLDASGRVWRSDSWTGWRRVPHFERSDSPGGSEK